LVAAAAGVDYSEVTAEAERVLRRLRWFHLGFMAAVAFYVFLVAQLQMLDTEFRFDGPGASLWALRGAFVLLSVAGVVVPGKLSFGPPKPAAPGRPSQQSLPAQRALTRGVLRLAFLEIIAVYGLFLYTMDGKIADFAAFWIVSFAGLVWWFPTSGRWARELAAAIRET